MLSVSAMHRFELFRLNLGQFVSGGAVVFGNQKKSANSWFCVVSIVSIELNDPDGG